MKKSGKLLTLTKLGMSFVLILCVSLATFFMTSCDLVTVVVNGKFIDENGNLILTYSNGDEEVVGHVKGVRGLHGCAAPDGQGIVEAKTDDLDQFVVVYSDGVTDEFGRVDESDDLPDSYADRVRIDSIIRDGDKMTIHYLRGEEAVVDIDCDYKCGFKSELSVIAEADMIKDEIRPHKKDEKGNYECGIYVLECPDCDGNIRRSVFHGIYHRELKDCYVVAEGENPCIDGGKIYKQCTVCGELIGDPVSVEAGKGHVWEEWSVKTAPTQETKGELERQCTVCHNFETISLDELPSFIPENEEDTEDIPPYHCFVEKFKETCDDPNGKVGYTYKIDEEHSFTFYAGIPVTEHEAPSPEETIVVDEEPGCFTPGKGHGHCPVCGAEVEVTIPAYGEHDFVIQKLVHDSGLKGHLVKKCARCGEINEDEKVDVEWIGKVTCADDWKDHPHYDQYRYTAEDGTVYETEQEEILEKPEHVIANKSTEEEIDVADIALKKDGAIVTVEDDESHKSIIVIDLEKAKNCNVDVEEFVDHTSNCGDSMNGIYGRGYIQCSRCGEYLLFATYKPHAGAWETTEPTCTEDGYRIYKCPDCGYVSAPEYPEELKATGHTPQYDELKKEADGTFTVKAHCAVCGQSLDKTNLKLVVDGVGDISESSKIIKQRDCKHDGIKEITYKYTDPDYPDVEVTFVKQEIIPSAKEAHLIVLKNGDTVSLEEVAVKVDGKPLMDGDLYVLDIDDERLQLREFAEQYANYEDCANGKYGRGYYICPVCKENVLIATFKAHP